MRDELGSSREYGVGSRLALSGLEFELGNDEIDERVAALYGVKPNPTL
jgi:hypothetical protein